MISSFLSLDRDSGEFFLEGMDQARKSICAAVYKFRDPEILDGLRRAADRGVDIRLVLDAEDARKGSSLAEEAARSGIRMRTWDPGSGKLHAKFAVIDGRTVLTGSSNWTLSARRSNVEILIRIEEAEAVGSFGDHFERLWRESIRFEERG